MKGASEYAKRLSRFLKPLKKQARRGQAGRQEVKEKEVIEEIVLAILEEGTGRAAARAALDSLKEWVVDYNDLRVTTPRELLRALDRSLPQAEEKAERISQVLNHVFDKRNSLNVNSLRDLPIREVRQFLNLLEGMTPFVSAAVIRRCLGGHAIPVDQVLERFLKDQELVPAEVDPLELQSFLEHHVLAADSPLFMTVVRRRALAHYRRVQAKLAREAGTTRRGKPARPKTAGRARRKGKSRSGLKRGTATRSRESTSLGGGRRSSR